MCKGRFQATEDFDFEFKFEFGRELEFGLRFEFEFEFELGFGLRFELELELEFGLRFEFELKGDCEDTCFSFALVCRSSSRLKYVPDEINTKLKYTSQHVK
jgi:hypothetical protein